jgi:hypothetical protein
VAPDLGSAFLKSETGRKKAQKSQKREVGFAHFVTFLRPPSAGLVWVAKVGPP